ncbi:hypothetical protein [Vagococcus bubulae]|uniref:Uncharacterized protein n=1 Tax=Vagococcus bubulae TaxID=1977868 RepID=A0A429ZQB8_9ENTE|nr:hypothetical protein [Vagococcus bubulae]RST95875.1 hypothetical protein CBF36_01525 [Vagococcus bubulae]
MEKKPYNSITCFKCVISFLLKIVFWGLIVFSISCFIWNVVKYHHISIIVLLIFGNSLFGLGLLKDLKNKSIKRMSFFTLIFVMMSFFIMYSIHYKLFFYHGEVVNDSIELNHDSIESLT